ncbi:hypothetical protein MNEG_1404 [Monoraphidium neglectum]|uniref:Uncharacterized protein n=1 Tax=Monoraphidium neglectum TaxID=145388 RepID=A0A0D2MVJ3_9CHLO|nr:hypothetical protein MNEG_1404 [Monoraphidium neglectum]KIZ06545.1 hypothetical protein MNEG_1404 [Monoraphidium neglectum]|eukprot:XP_013905564.1 hypothetical protein MNEG_1404 [Monoraphidium neglectum]
MRQAQAPESTNVAEAHEFDYSRQRQLVYDEDDVRVYSTPVDHYFTEGPVAYRLEWGGMAVVIGGDTAPVMTLAELSEAADVLVLDAMATALDNEKGVAGAEDGAPLEGSDGGGGGRGAAAGAARGTTVRERRNIVTSHTTPAEAGRMFAAAAPRLAIATHNAINGFSLPHIVSEVRKSYVGPLSVAQDLDYWDVCPDRIEAGRLLAAAESWGLIFGDGAALAGGGRGGAGGAAADGRGGAAR